MTYRPHPFKMKHEGRLISLDMSEEKMQTKCPITGKLGNFYLATVAKYSYKSKTGKTKYKELILYIKWM
ncbi:hypothetical protein [Providencia phage PSTRCR_127]|nr:hypothetical protein [Providencia phage PSTRCR_127]